MEVLHGWRYRWPPMVRPPVGLRLRSGSSSHGHMRLSDIIGHDQAKRLLQGSLQRDRLHHALLLHGPDGVGKRSLARAWAALLLCDAPVVDVEGRLDACGACGSCRTFHAGRHPDFVLVEAEARTIKLDQIKEVVASTRYRPTMSKRRVVLLLDAHDLRDEGANALLKTLEEPGGETVFVLVTSQAQRLLNTIRSRTQQLRLQSLTPAAVMRVLEQQGVARERATLLTRLSGGAPGVALALAKDDAWARRDLDLRAMHEVLDRPGVAGLALAERWASDREHQEERLSLLVAWLRDVSWLGAGGAQEACLLPHAVEGVAAWSDRLPPPACARLASLVDGARARLRGNVHARLVFESLWIDIASALERGSLRKDGL